MIEGLISPPPSWWASGPDLTIDVGGGEMVNVNTQRYLRGLTADEILRVTRIATITIRRRESYLLDDLAIKAGCVAAERTVVARDRFGSLPALETIERSYRTLWRAWLWAVDAAGFHFEHRRGHSMTWTTKDSGELLAERPAEGLDRVYLGEPAGGPLVRCWTGDVCELCSASEYPGQHPDSSKEWSR